MNSIGMIREMYEEMVRIRSTSGSESAQCVRVRSKALGLRRGFVGHGGIGDSIGFLGSPHDGFI